MPRKKKKITRKLKKSSRVPGRSASIKLAKSHLGFKFSESYISLILGILVVLVASILVFTFSKNRTYDRINTAVSTYQELTTSDQHQENSKKTYEVKSGDSLWAIAEKVYGSGYNWVDIASANKLKNPGAINAGDSLTIPEVKKIVVENSSAQNSTTSITDSSYTIQSGDNLWDIAVRRYGDGYKWPEIARLNNVPNPNLIYSGNTLKLPN
ncbi:MAG TPA: LysM peptidoglycan-binding domain-containing protein [Patescibacteria group bacterium]|nr:LysM peptidoglycan-binding domain-containing protein [Patescibacteria group bacterium]